jgi:hypothetical protein
MHWSSLPPEALTDVFWATEDIPTSFLAALAPERKRGLLCEIARSVFERRRVELTNNLKASQLLELIALIISKTYAARGDSFQLADDVALMRIADLLLEHDPHIVRRYSQTRVTEEQLLKQFQRTQGSIE